MKGQYIKSVSIHNLRERKHDYFGMLVRVLLQGLLVIIIFTLFVAILKSAQDSIRAINEPLETILENILLDIVFIVAVVEITTVVRGYLEGGRVRIRYIIDAVLAIIANEFVVVWFHNPTIEKVIGLCLSLISLTLVRVMITHYLPDD